MTPIRTWIGSLVLRFPGPFQWARKLPLAGTLMHKLSYKVLKSDSTVWARIEHGPAEGLWFELNPRTGRAYMRGDTETAVQNFLVSRLKKSDVFFDLGANIGLFTLIAAHIIGPEGYIFSFEPDPQNAERLRRNLKRNYFQNVAVIQAGVWSSTGERQFEAAESTSPDRGIGTFVLSNSKGEATSLIKCVSLDDFVKSARLPTGIKCDVEGAEVEVIKGALDLVARCRPWILFEMHTPENDREIRAMLSSCGYSFRGIDDVHVVAEPNPDIQ